MRKMKLFCFVLLACFGLVLSACAVPPTTGGSPAGSKEQPADRADQPASGDLMAGIKVEPVARTGLPAAAMLKEFSRFSDELFFASLANEGNILISPPSAYLALAMTLNGAAAKTQEAMLTVLAGQGSSVQDVNQAASGWLEQLDWSNDDLQMKTANSIWLRQGIKASEDFLESNAAHYAAGARQLDFAAPGAAEEINSWVEKNTNGLIKELVENIDPATVIYLINTLYFKADWQAPFAKHETRQQTFFGPPAREVDFMHQTGQLPFFTAENAQGIYLPYAGGRFAYFAILPDQGLDPVSWLASQGETEFFAKIAGWLARANLTDIMLALPRYQASYTDSLVNELSDMGMANAFSGDQADFSRLLADGGKGLHISEVKHMTLINVDEKGTEAAAATSVVIRESAAMSGQELIFDRPFVYGIMDLTLGLPLFAGILFDPLAG